MAIFAQTFWCTWMGEFWCISVKEWLSAVSAKLGEITVSVGREEITSVGLGLGADGFGSKWKERVVTHLTYPGSTTLQFELVFGLI